MHTLWSAQEGETAVVEVADEGMGIPGEAQARLFESFYRAGNSGYQSGFGLGLYIVREIVQRHGGWVEVESTERRGTTFRVRLPLVDGADEAPSVKQCQNGA
jgi:two-component system, OmpR family, sensor histidine kinase VicK